MKPNGTNQLVKLQDALNTWITSSFVLLNLKKKSGLIHFVLKILET